MPDTFSRLFDYSILEVGRYIENIVIYLRYRYDRYKYRIGTLDIVFFDIAISYSVTSEISVFFYILSYFFGLFNGNLKINNYMSKTEYLIWQFYTSLHSETEVQE